MTTLTADPVAESRTPRTRARRVVVGRRLAATALVVGSALNAAESIVSRRLIDPEGTPAERFAAVEEHGLALNLALAAGIVAIPLMLLAFQAMAHLVRPHAPRLAAVGAGLTLVGCFGFLGIHIPSVVESAAVAENLDPVAVDAVLSSVETSPLGGLVVGAFLLGLFGGLSVLAVGLWRSRAVPRWVPAALGSFLVLDFLANGRTGGLDPHPLWVAACVGTAAVVLRRTDAEWENA